MDRLGDATLKPFLQDVIQLKPLVQTMSKQASGSGGGGASGLEPGTLGWQCGQLLWPLRCTPPCCASGHTAHHPSEHSVLPAAPAGFCCRFVSCPQMVTDPLMVPQILARVGPGAVADWMLHLLGLAAYTFLDWDAKVG